MSTFIKHLWKNPNKKQCLFHQQVLDICICFIIKTNSVNESINPRFVWTNIFSSVFFITTSQQKFNEQLKKHSIFVCVSCLFMTQAIMALHNILLFQVTIDFWLYLLIFVLPPKLVVTRCLLPLFLSFLCHVSVKFFKPSFLICTRNFGCLFPIVSTSLFLVFIFLKFFFRCSHVLAIVFSTFGMYGWCNY